MNRLIVLLVIMMFQFSLLFSQSNMYQYYADNNLNIRQNDSTSSTILATIAKNTALKINFEGRADTVDGKTSKWMNITSQNGYSGWCFGAYIKMIEKNCIEGLAIDFTLYKNGSFPGNYIEHKYSKRVPLELIKNKSGYYIQQEKRRFQGSGYAPEILQLSIEDQKVIIKEVDIKDDEIVVRKKIELILDGNSYSKGNTKLRNENDNILIYYRENIPKNEWLGSWDYDVPFTYVCSLAENLASIVFERTSDYLYKYEGDYYFDSYKVLQMKNVTIDLDSIKGSVLPIKYDKSKKALSIGIHELTDFYEGKSEVGPYVFYFVETKPNEPFYWTYGESVGYTEDRFFFYKNGIAFTEEIKGFKGSDENEEPTDEYYIKYVVFFKRK
jgi:uncharacterized protein YgiM (DUF1202 family)